MKLLRSLTLVFVAVSPPSIGFLLSFYELRDEAARLNNCFAVLQLISSFVFGFVASEVAKKKVGMPQIFPYVSLLGCILGLSLAFFDYHWLGLEVFVGTTLASILYLQSRAVVFGLDRAWVLLALGRVVLFFGPVVVVFLTVPIFVDYDLRRFFEPILAISLAFVSMLGIICLRRTTRVRKSKGVHVGLFSLASASSPVFLVYYERLYEMPFHLFPEYYLVLILGGGWILFCDLVNRWFIDYLYSSDQALVRKWYGPIVAGVLFILGLLGVGLLILASSTLEILVENWILALLLSFFFLGVSLPLQAHIFARGSDLWPGLVSVASIFVLLMPSIIDMQYETILFLWLLVSFSRCVLLFGLTWFVSRERSWC